MVHLEFEENGRVRTFDLHDGSYVVGRGLEADLRLESGTVSRRHAVLEVDENQIWVRDLGSLWGTFVGSKRLAEDDRLSVPSGTLLRFAQVQMWDHDAPRPRIPRLAEEADETTGVRERRRMEISEISSRRTLPMLRHLFHIFTAGDKGHEIEKEACLFVKDWIDADRVCLFEAEEPGIVPPIRGWWSRDPLDEGSLLISERLVREVLETGELVAWSRGPDPSELDSEDSRFRLDIHSAIAVPILAAPAIRGVLYVDRRRMSEDYEDEDIEVLVATACAVAMRRAVSQGQIETKKAARIQLQMLPTSLPEMPGYELDAGLHMCQGVGGDLYDCICRSDERCLLSVGDVSGKGLPAALLMGATSFLVRALAELEISPLEIYSRVHRNLLPKYRAQQFVALFLAELEPSSGTLRCVVAGVPPPMIIRRNGEVEELGPTAFAAALIDLDEPPPTDIGIVLEPGDLLAVFTDGYPEATPDGEKFLEAQVTELLSQNRDLPLREIRDKLDKAVDEFVGAGGPSDDRTLMLLRRNVEFDASE